MIAHVLFVRGAPVVVGSDPDAAQISDEELLSLLGKCVVVVRPDGRRLNAAVRDASISRSLVGQRNLMLAFSPDLELDGSDIGGFVEW